MLNTVTYYLSQYWKDESDDRSSHLLGVGTPPLLIPWLLAGYISFAKLIGPQLMKDVEPFQLRKLMFVYNTIMALFNGISFIVSVKFSNYGLRLMNFEYPNRHDMSEQTILELHLGYLYLITKFFDLIDTLFFILRKKSSHITLLHLYHHSIVPIFGFLLIKISPALPAVGLFAIVNSFIHVVMYSYYALSAMGPNVQKYLWWKKYITIMQLWQFVIYAIYGALIFIFQTNYPIVWLYVGLTQPPLFWWLFYDFYVKAYQSRKSRVNGEINNKTIDKNK